MIVRGKAEVIVFACFCIPVDYSVLLTENEQFAAEGYQEKFTHLCPLISAVSYLENAPLPDSSWHTWEGLKRQVGVCVMATADQNPIKDQALLFPIHLHNNIPLSTDSEVWTLSHAPHFGLRMRKHRWKHKWLTSQFLLRPLPQVPQTLTGHSSKTFTSI